MVTIGETVIVTTCFGAGVDVPFRLVAPAKYAEAHPDEPDVMEGGDCSHCAIAERVGTRERFILWLCGGNSRAGATWSVNRADPKYAEFNRQH